MKGFNGSVTQLTVGVPYNHPTGASDAVDWTWCLSTSPSDEFNYATAAFATSERP